MKVNVSGSWKEGIPWVNVGGSWKKAVAEWVNVSGVWKKVAYAFNNIVLGTELTEGKYGAYETVYYSKDRTLFTKSDPEYPVSTVQVYARRKSGSYNAYIKLRFTNVDESSRLVNALTKNQASLKVVGTGSQSFNEANAAVTWDASTKELTVTPDSATSMYNMLLGQFRAKQPATVTVEYKD